MCTLNGVHNTQSAALHQIRTKVGNNKSEQWMRKSKKLQHS
jgi:hypothetical protein